MLTLLALTAAATATDGYQNPSDDIVAILEALKEAGALRAELIVI